MTDYGTDYDPNAPETLASLLGAVVNVYWNQYQHYWELVGRGPDARLTDEHREFCQRLDELGEAMRGSLHTLAP